MDDDGLNMRNWGYYEPSLKEPLGFQLMPPFGDHRDTKPLMINPNGGGAVTGYHHHHQHQHQNQPSLPMQHMRDSWIQRERLLHMFPGNNNYSVINDSPASSSMHIMQPIDLSKDHEISVEDDDSNAGGGDGSNPPKKRSAPKNPKGKKPKKAKENGTLTGQRSKVMKRNIDMVINGIDMDISGIPIPVCSCTGNPQQCYRWGSGGWQSACCTTTISMYPLPMSTKRRGARIAGRKMSQGAFKKVLEKLASEGYNFADAIDLRLHWAKHGTNKFVTIR